MTMLFRDPFAIALTVFAVLCGVTAGAAANAASVTGTAVYRERIALPPEAVFEATLSDVSRADAPAELIDRQRITNPGNPPIAFELNYDPNTIAANHSYAVRATITLGERLLFVTDMHYPVITRGNPNEVDVIMRKY